MHSSKKPRKLVKLVICNTKPIVLTMNTQMFTMNRSNADSILLVLFRPDFTDSSGTVFD